MSAKEETINAGQTSRPRTTPLGNRVINFLSSVRFGVVLLCILVVLSIIGMVVIQQNVQGFDSYYASLTPAERTVFGFLGIFDIYHSWYYNVLLLVLSLNIVLASIEHFPTAWKGYIAKPKVTATRDFLINQPQHSVYTSQADESEVLESLGRSFAKHGFKPRISETTTLSYPIGPDGKKQFSAPVSHVSKVLFGQRGKYNRLGAYWVHVSLLTLFLGHFVALQTGFDADMRMIPGETTDQMQRIEFNLDKKEKFNVQVPFTMTCTDIQQKLIDPRGGIDVTNTLDWRTQMRIDDPEYGSTVADISMNQPFNYRGFRFFQAQTIPVGNARKIVLDITPMSGGETMKVEIARLGTAQLGDGTFIEYEEFLPDFTFGPDGRPDTKSGDYNNPVAVLGVTPPGGERVRVFAFGSNVPDNLPVAAPKAGYKWRIAEFEKSPFAHVLSIKYDPYSGAFIAWYFGGFGLMGALVYVFFFSHKRVWARVEKLDDGKIDIVIGGHTNRNHAGFEEKFAKLSADVRAALPGTVAGPETANGS